jgi:hypothetical protein
MENNMAQIEIDIDRNDAIKLIDKDLKEYYEVGKQIKDLTNKQNDLKAEITSILKKFFKRNDDYLYKNDTYYARISEATRSTLKKELIEKFLNVSITNECYTYTKYDTMKIDTIENYNKKKQQAEKHILMENSKPVEFKIDL